MQPNPPTPLADPRSLDDALIIRMATPEDAVAIRRLAELDSAAEPEPVPMLVAEVGGELQAALSLDAAVAVANPFERTAELAAMLAARVQQRQGPTPQPPTRRLRSIRIPRLAPASRA